MYYRRIIPKKLSPIEALKNMAIQFKQNKDANFYGTHLQGVIDCPYAELVQIFGEPILFTPEDSDKVDAEWVLEAFDEETQKTDVVTIYNYKDGKVYLGEEGLNASEITDWHIGGRSELTYNSLKLFINEARGFFPVKTEGAGTW